MVTYMPLPRLIISHAIVSRCRSYPSRRRRRAAAGRCGPPRIPAGATRRRTTAPMGRRWSCRRCCRPRWEERSDQNRQTGRQYARLPDGRARCMRCKAALRTVTAGAPDRPAARGLWWCPPQEEDVLVSWVALVFLTLEVGGSGLPLWAVARA